MATKKEIYECAKITKEDHLKEKINIMEKCDSNI